MKETAHIQEARHIGADSYELQHFEQLPENATKQQQIDAIAEDIQWQHDHTSEIICHMERLQRDIAKEI